MRALLVFAMLLAVPCRSQGVVVTENADAGAQLTTAQVIDIAPSEIESISGSALGIERDADAYLITSEVPGLLKASTYGSNDDHMPCLVEVSSGRTECLHEDAGNFNSRMKGFLKAGEPSLVAIGPEWMYVCPNAMWGYTCAMDELGFEITASQPLEGGAYDLGITFRNTPVVREVPQGDIACAENSIDVGSLDSLDMVTGFLEEVDHPSMWFKGTLSRPDFMGGHNEVNLAVGALVVINPAGETVLLKGADRDDPINIDLGGVFEPGSLAGQLPGIYTIGVNVGSTLGYDAASRCFTVQETGWLIKEGNFYFLPTGGWATLRDLTLTSEGDQTILSFVADETNRIFDFLYQVRLRSTGALMLRDSIEARWRTTTPFVYSVPLELASGEYDVAVTPRTRGTYDDFYPLEADAITTSFTVAGENDPGAYKSGLALSGPNPVISSTRFTISLPRREQVRIALYDVLGREVAVITDRLLPHGESEVVLDASTLPPGSYVVRAVTSSSVHTLRVTKVR